jgi:hypothetical protein
VLSELRRLIEILRGLEHVREPAEAECQIFRVICSTRRITST